jgi:DNA-binding PadR family transcriptional regulator
MINTKGTSVKLNLLGRYRRVMRNTNNDYKAEYNRMFLTKMSSSSFLLLYTLFLLNKKPEPLYGAEMLTEIRRGVSFDIWGPSHGTYYPLLERMVNAGYIENAKSTPSRKFYTITKLGTEELKLKLDEFKPMLIESSKFFSNVLTEMYDE